MRDRIHVIVDLKIILIETLLIVDGVFCGFCDLGHGLDRKNRIGTGCGFSRQHHCAGAVIYRVGNVRGFGSCRTRVVNHGFQHLGSGDDTLAENTAAGDQIFLDRRQTFKRNFNTHIAAGNHDAVAFFTDLIDIVIAGLILDLGNQFHGIIFSEGFEQVVDIHKILFDGNKRAGDKVNVIGNSEGNIRLVLFGQICLLHMLAGEAHRLAVGKLSAGQNFCDNPSPLCGKNFKLKQRIVQKNAVARRKLICEIFIAYRNNGIIPDDFLGGKGELFAFLQVHFPVFKGSDPEFRAFCVQHDRNRKTQFFSDFLDPIDPCKMFFMGAV